MIDKFTPEFLAEKAPFTYERLLGVKINEIINHLNAEKAEPRSYKDFGEVLDEDNGKPSEDSIMCKHYRHKGFCTICKPSAGVSVEEIEKILQEFLNTNEYVILSEDIQELAHAIKERLDRKDGR